MLAHRRMIPFVLVGVVIIAAMMLFLVFHRHREKLPADPQQRWMWEWTHRSFTPISTNVVENRKLVERFPIDFQTGLTKTQEEKLLDAVAQVLTIYRTGDWEQFRRFVQARGGNIDAKSLEGLETGTVFGTPKSELSPHDQEIFKDWKEWPPAKPWDKLQAWWTYDYYPPGTGVWSGLDLSDARIKVFQRMLPFSNSQASMQEEAREMLELSGNKQVGEMWNIPHIDYPVDKGPYTYALVYFVARYQADSHAGPYGLWFRWSPGVQNWIMERTMALYSGMRANNVNLQF
jgi:hypothetical protein